MIADDYGLMKFDVGGNSNLTTGSVAKYNLRSQTISDEKLLGYTNQKTFEANSCDLGYVALPNAMSGVGL